MGEDCKEGLAFLEANSYANSPWTIVDLPQTGEATPDLRAAAIGPSQQLIRQSTLKILLIPRMLGMQSFQTEVAACWGLRRSWHPKPKLWQSCVGDIAGRCLAPAWCQSKMYRWECGPYTRSDRHEVTSAVMDRGSPGAPALDDFAEQPQMPKT